MAASGGNTGGYAATMDNFVPGLPRPDEELRDRSRWTVGGKDYVEPSPAALLDKDELKKWSFYRAVIVECVTTVIVLIYYTAGGCSALLAHRTSSPAGSCSALLTH
nr:aquaporin PIP2-7-like [Ipomoea trifida]